MRLGRSTGHPGRASTTPEMSATGPDGWTEPGPAGRTPQEALTRTRAAVGSNHRACGPNHRIVAISGLRRFAGPAGSASHNRVVLAAGAPGGLDHGGGSPPSRPGRGHGPDESGDQVDAESCPSPAAGLRRPAAGRDGRRDHGARADQPGAGQRRDLDVRVARVFAAPGSGPVHRDAAADHQLDSPHLAMLVLAAVQGLDRLRRAFC
jgi:hypothetical protein